MHSICRTMVVAGLAVLGVGLGQNGVRAQYYYNPYAAYARAQYAQQAMYAQQVMNAQMMARTNYAYHGAYYPNYANTMGPGFPIANQPLVNPVRSMDPYSGSTGNPYAPVDPGYGVSPPSIANPANPANPYNPLNPYNPYNPLNPYNNPYNSFGSSYGMALMGEAALQNARANAYPTMEGARLMREQYNQARIDTRKKQFDLDNYIKANTPSLNEEQARIAKSTLKRIQTYSTPGEITSGKALNYLLDDLRKYQNKKVATLEPIMMSEGMLASLNVCGKGNYGIGILRNDGRISWPSALQEMLSVNQRKDLDKQIKALVMAEANNGKLDPNVLSDVRTEMEKIRADLVAKVNEIPTSRYLDAKRFLQEFQEASVALERGELKEQMKFQRFIEGGKSIQDVVDYMIEKGLRFGPATGTDEAAYRAVHSALASHDVALNAQLGIVLKE